MQIEIWAKELQAVALFMAKKDVRYYLNGIAIVDDKLTATNGHMLLQIKLDKAIDHTLIIPDNAVTGMLRALSARSKQTQSITITCGGTHALSCEGTEIKFTPIDAEYPDVSSVIPNNPESFDAIKFNWESFAQFSKAAKILGNNSGVALAELHTGMVAKISLAYEREVIGIIMPLSKGAK